MSINRQLNGGWNYASYAALPDDGLRHQIVDGDHFMNPAPNLYHQVISKRMQFQLYSEIELKEQGVVFNAPCDLQLSEVDIVQPDLIVILQSNYNILTASKILGVPDLIVEILSPSNPELDLTIKRELYQRFGVPEYWIVSPEEQTVTQLHLVEGEYLDTVHSDLISMLRPPGALVDLTKVW